MRRKPKEEPVIAPQILSLAKRSVHMDGPAIKSQCVVCGSDAAPNSTEKLCWVCRRLKISAWRENDQQLPVQE
ncbi:MAG: hypothetical protein HYZ37_00300 [Candidatus Solibacter usitatus]|nr:hypothetical protein [Candidatus Solibacter usitatus]